MLGKWLAAVVFFAAAWTPTLLYPVYLRAVGADLDAGAIASGYLGTALVGAASLAVGLAASAVTRHQLLAAALSFVAFVGASAAGGGRAHRCARPRWPPPSVASACCA